MNHYTLPSFWDCYQQLPLGIKKLADKNFELLKDNTGHPSLQFKAVGKFWSVRVNQQYRALGVMKPEGCYWFWVGTHTEYDKLLSQ